MANEELLLTKAERGSSDLYQRLAPRLQELVDLSVKQSELAVRFACTRVLFMQIRHEVQTFPLDKGLRNLASQVCSSTEGAISGKLAERVVNEIAIDVGLLTPASSATDPDKYMQSEQAGMQEMLSATVSNQQADRGTARSISGEHDPDSWYRNK